MKTNALVNLYIVQTGDTIDSICEKFDISKQVFYRYNKILKYIPLIPNSPVHIVSFTENQIINIDLDNDEIAISLTSIAYIIKECIISTIYIKDNFKYNKIALDKEHDNLVNSLSLSSEQKAILKKQMEKVNYKIIDATEIILSNDKEKLAQYEKEMNTTINEMADNLKSIYFEANKELLSEKLKDISKQYQTLTIRLILKKYEEVYEIFKKIISNFEIINKSLLLH